MNNKFKICGSNKFIEGNIRNLGKVVFIPYNNNTIIKKSSYISGISSDNYATIFKLYLDNSPTKITKKNRFNLCY